MTSCEFLNAAHAVFVEELMRPQMARGVTIPGLSLEEALETASVYAEGWSPESLTPAVTANEPRPEPKPRQKTEAEIVEQNNRALAQLQAMTANMKGGFSNRN